MMDDEKLTKTNDFGFRIEISTSRPGQIDLQDGARLFSIMAWPGKPIFGLKILAHIVALELIWAPWAHF